MVSVTMKERVAWILKYMGLWAEGRAVLRKNGTLERIIYYAQVYDL